MVEVVMGDGSGTNTNRGRIEFEDALHANFRGRLLEDPQFGRQLWSALTNTHWRKRDVVLLYNFRTAGALIVALRSTGDADDWYCCAPPGRVSEEIGDPMAASGWLHRPATEGEPREGRP